MARQPSSDKAARNIDPLSGKKKPDEFFSIGDQSTDISAKIDHAAKHRS